MVEIRDYTGRRAGDADRREEVVRSLERIAPHCLRLSPPFLTRPGPIHTAHPDGGELSVGRRPVGDGAVPLVDTSARVKSAISLVSLPA